MKFTLRILAVILFLLISDSIGIILAYYFDNPSLRLNCVSVTAAISGYLVRGWWPPEEKEGAE
ncbi:hypothetical protein FE207_02820 [Bacillus subtilis]|nr:hypothetical protein [Bacillus subtilis]NJF06933.1 hypothetical protein [Bacillus subtilis]PAE61154.1 hypothetical protein CHH88_04610 [Bacillus subtilis]CAF1781095.1 hypothetical protein NRS6108_03785 [Bacillus subtilis]CAF1877120.1 hypothetical protein NRS6181_04311 [Bacillus subtilis]